jgi:glycosyltransferase 2 family protein
VSEPAPVELPRRWRWRIWAWRAVSLVLLGLVIYYVGKQLARDMGELRNQQTKLSINWLLLILSALCLMGSRVMNSLNTWLLLKALGADLPPKQVVGAIWLSSLGRYIPGKVAVVAGSMTMLTRMGARLPVVGAALLLSTGIMILIAMMATTPLFFLPEVRQRLPSAPLFWSLVVAMAIVCLHPRIYLAICNIALRMIRREPVPPRVRAGAFWWAIGLGVGRMILVGLALWLAARAVGPVEIRSMPHFLGTAALATAAGFFAIFAPAGIGVHEAVYLFTLTPLLGARVAMVVILFRLLQVAIDLVAGAIGGNIMRKERRSPLGARQTPAAISPTGGRAQPVEQGGV